MCQFFYISGFTKCMKVNLSPRTFLSRIKPTNKASDKIIYHALGTMPCDSFKKSQDNGQIRTVTVKDLNGQDIEAKILREVQGKDKYEKKSGIVKFSIFIDGEQVGFTTVQDNAAKDKLYLSHIYTEENSKRKYKGLGTELIKSAILESQSRGYKGRITLCAMHTPLPFVFYYKNNFKAAQGTQSYNGAIEYAIKNNIPIEEMFLSSVHSLDMELSEDGANALLNKENFYKSSEFKTFKKEINGKTYEAALIKSNDEYYFIIVNTSDNVEKLKLSAVGKVDTLDNGRPYLKFYNVDDSAAVRKILQLAFSSANALAQDFGFEGGIITNEYIKEE